MDIVNWRNVIIPVAPPNVLILKSSNVFGYASNWRNFSNIFCLSIKLNFAWTFKNNSIWNYTPIWRRIETRNVYSLIPDVYTNLYFTVESWLQIIQSPKNGKVKSAEVGKHGSKPKMGTWKVISWKVLNLGKNLNGF